jgi:SAM-dependent methyltransferase
MAPEVRNGVLPDSFAGLARLLRCPICRARIEAANDCLVCSAGHRFEVRAGVPRFVANPTESGSSIRDKTSKAFGDQWNELGDLAAVGAADLRLHLPDGFSLEQTFTGLVLDAGCGMGRYTALAREVGARAVGLDLSRAVDKAVARWPDLPFIQGDLNSPPLAEQRFDLVFSFGVLHHLPDPGHGFAKCFSLVKPGGLLLVWVYSSHGGVLRGMRRMLRTLSRRAPSTVRPMALAAASIIWYGYLVPSRWLKRGSALRFYGEKGFHQLYVDCHDALAAPLEAYLSENECRRWIQSLEAAKSGIQKRRDGTGWIVWAARSANPEAERTPASSQVSHPG